MRVTNDTKNKKNVGAPAHRRPNKGITLIALIITIIVMLILVAVTINMAVNGGLFEKAGKATQETQNAVDEEQKLANGRIQIDGIWYDSIDDYMNRIPSENQENVEKTVSRYRALGILAGEKTVLEDDEKNTVVLPAEFKISKNSATTVNDGVVIEDEEGNQYVWVPVTKDAEGGNTEPYAESGTLADGTEIKLSRYRFNPEGIATDKGDDYIADYYSLGSVGTPLWATVESSSSEIVNVANNIEEFKTSVAENGGYYIARYEASYRAEDGKAMSKVSVVYEGDDREEGMLYNYVTQLEASEACQNLYLNVKSDLMNSYAYDTAIVYIQTCSENTTYSIETSKNNSISNTGTNGDEVCKINDLASNLGEWTTEWATWCAARPADTTNGGVCRGGRYSQPTYFSSFRGENNASYITDPTVGAEDIGFRAILYI